MNKVAFGTRPAQVSCEYQFIGNDLLIVIAGGTHPHVGAIAIGEPRQSRSREDETSASVSVLTRIGHKDDEIAKSVAYQLSSFLNCYTIVIAGLHIDNASVTEIDALVKNTNVLITWLLNNITPQ